MVCRHTPHSLATSPTVRPSAMTARTALYLCSVTLISFMAGECRVGTEVAVANQPKVCSTAAEGVLSPSSRTCTQRYGWLAGLEPATPRSTIWCSAMLSYSHRGAGQESSGPVWEPRFYPPRCRTIEGDGDSGRIRPDDQVRRADRVPSGDDSRVSPRAQAHAHRLGRYGTHLRARLLPRR